MLSATNKGLGSCWIGSFKEPKTENKLKQILKTNQNEELVASLLIGYPKEDFKPIKRKKKQLSEILKFV